MSESDNSTELGWENILFNIHGNTLEKGKRLRESSEKPGAVSNDLLSCGKRRLSWKKGGNTKRVDQLYQTKGGGG